MNIVINLVSDSSFPFPHLSANRFFERRTPGCLFPMISSASVPVKCPIHVHAPDSENWVHRKLRFRPHKYEVLRVDPTRLELVISAMRRQGDMLELHTSHTE